MASSTTSMALAIIPARGGSKGLPGKNLAAVGGRSLIRRAVEACVDAVTISDVIVSTDDRAIAAEAERAGAVVVDRPVHLAGDDASSESALLHALDSVPSSAGVVAFVQCTSPFIDSSDLDEAVEMVASGNCDVAFAATTFHRFIWRPSADGGFAGVNHDAGSRARRQDRPVEVCETGAFYVFRRDGFERHRHRFFGTVQPMIVPSAAAIEVDDADDLALARAFADPDRAAAPRIDRAVGAVITDFDGVHTDNRAIVDEHGFEGVYVHRGDGLGVARLRAAGVPVLILSTEVNPVVRRRAEKLGVDCLMGCSDKLPALRAWLDARGVDPRHAVYVGNDQNDADCLQAVGLPVVVADAHPLVRHLARWTTAAPGGFGAVREVSDAVLSSLAERASDSTPTHVQEPAHVTN